MTHLLTALRRYGLVSLLAMQLGTAIFLYGRLVERIDNLGKQADRVEQLVLTHMQQSIPAPHVPSYSLNPCPITQSRVEDQDADATSTRAANCQEYNRKAVH